MQRAKEERIGVAVQILLLGGFVVALALLGRSMLHLFATHGDALGPWIRGIALVGVALVLLFTIHRILLKVSEFRELVHEIHELEARVRALRAELRRRN